MTFDEISIRLGMHQGLYLGICIGVIISSLIILAECCILNLGVTLILAASLALTCAALLVIGLICIVQNREWSSSDLACTCRYRRSLHTLCHHCAMHPGHQDGEKPRADPQE